MTDISLPSTLTSIGASAFLGCTGFTEIILPNGMKSLGTLAFKNCTNLERIVIPSSLTNVGGRWGDYNDQGPFLGCSKLSTVEFEGNMQKIHNYMFLGCSGLETIVIPEGVTTIENYAFYSCGKLANVTLPNTLTSIGVDSFGYCAKITSITLPNSLTSIGKLSFRNCTGLTGIAIPVSVTSIGETAFTNCTSLATATFAGTRTQWISVSKGAGNNNICDIIQCSDDGQVNSRSNNIDIEYIQSNGTQYIDTYYYENINTKIEFEAMCTDTRTSDIWTQITGSKSKYHASSAIQAAYNPKSVRLAIEYGTSSVSGMNIDKNTKFSVVIANNAHYIYDTSCTQNGTFSGTSSYSLWIFDTNDAGKSEQRFIGRIYSYKIYEGETLIKNFVPVQNTYLNKAGLYDTVAGKFYYSLGTGAFVAPE